MKDKGKGKFVDEITGTELTYQEAVRLQILYENALIESGKTYSVDDIPKINIEQSEVDKYRVKKYNSYKRKKFGSASYKRLQSAVMERNLRHYPNRKDVNYTFTANDFHVYQNVGDGFDVWESIKIDGNEDIIYKLREGIDNGTIREPGVFRKVHDELRNRERVDGDTGGLLKDEYLEQILDLFMEICEREDRPLTQEEVLRKVVEMTQNLDEAEFKRER